MDHTIVEYVEDDPDFMIVNNMDIELNDDPLRVGIFNVELLESRPQARPLQRKKKTKYRGKLIKHPSEMTFGTYEDHQAYSEAWHLREQKRACKTR